jgi:hypothetical protein
VGQNPEQDEKGSDVIDITDILGSSRTTTCSICRSTSLDEVGLHPASSIMFGDLIDTARAMGAAEGR